MKPTNNDVLGGYTKEVSCARCHKPRWVRVDVPEPYTCRRCRAVLAGRPADDPLGKPATPEQLERLRKAREAKGRRAV